MEKTKLKLNELKVQSFVTEFDKQKGQTMEVNGGWVSLGAASCNNWTCYNTCWLTCYDQTKDDWGTANDFSCRIDGGCGSGRCNEPTARPCSALC